MTVKNVDYCCFIQNINKSKTINKTILENSVLEDSRYI